MHKPQFPQRVFSHQSAFVNISIDAVDSALGGILPRCVVVTVVKNRFSAAVLGNHKLVAVNLSSQIMVVEVCTSI